MRQHHPDTDARLNGSNLRPAPVAGSRRRGRDAEQRSREEGAIVTRAGVAKVITFKLVLATCTKGLVAASRERRQSPGCLRSPAMTETPHKTGPVSAEFSADVLESVEIVRAAPIEEPCRAA